MPFQLATIEDLFHNSAYNYLVTYHKLKENKNYPIITDYLTGKTTSLQGLDSSQNNIVFFPLLDLVKSPGAPQPDDNLVFDVLFHPDIFYPIQYYVYQWLAVCLLQHDDDKNMQAVLALFQRAGLQSRQVFELVIHYLQNQPAAYEMVTKMDSPLRHFLLQNFPASTAHRQHNVGPFYFGNDWNYLYFLLMEEAQPHLAEQYLFNGLLSSQEQTVTNLLQHRGGKYIPAIVQWIQHPHQSEFELMAMLRAAVLLNELDKGNYGDLIVQASKMYLQNYPVYFGKHRWEPGFDVPEFEGTEISRFTYSAIAMHYLCLQKKNG